MTPELAASKNIFDVSDLTASKIDEIIDELVRL
jgi:hypothetical protein